MGCRRGCLRVVIRVQQGRQCYHEPALYGMVAVVVDKLERLDVRYQMPLADAAVLPELPFQQADPALAVEQFRCRLRVAKQHQEGQQGPRAPPACPPFPLLVRGAGHIAA